MRDETPRWLGGPGMWGGHAQTIWPALVSRRFALPAPHYRRERWTTPDGDFIDVDWLTGAPGEGVPSPPPEGVRPALRRLGGEVPSAAAPLLVLFHGLEGSSASHYAVAFAQRARELGWRYAVPHFRGCSGEINLAPRAYHSGDFEEVGWILQRMRSAHAGPIVAVGVSLGGNALLRWAEEAGDTAAQTVRAVCAISAPLDLAAGGAALGRGFNRLVYTRMFLNTMRPKALRKLSQHKGLFNRERMLSARDLYEFDNLYTAPLHGFRNTEDYWARASAKPHLRSIRVPALVVNARNDPFVPAASLPVAADVGAHVTLWQPAHGGHVGFAQGRFPGHLRSVPEQVADWLELHL
jgi:uncharacterized protein